LDNQIDTTSGTVKLKAQFSNEDSNLFPNQFVNVQLLSNTLQDVATVPNAAIQHGSVGDFVYKISRDKNNSFKDGSKDVTKNAPKDLTIEGSKVALKEIPAESTKVAAKDEPKDNTQEGTKGGWSKNGKKGGGAVANIKVQIVRLGIVDGDYVQVLDGLRPGDQVVVSGIEKLKDNAKVIVTKAEKPDGSSGKSGHRGNHADAASQTNDEDTNKAREQRHGSHGANGEHGNFKRVTSINNAGDESGAVSFTKADQATPTNAVSAQVVDTKTTEPTNAENATWHKHDNWSKRTGAKTGTEGSDGGARQRPEGGRKRHHDEDSISKSANNEQ
jgi:hypothetical protein